MPTKYYFDNAATTPVREEVLQEILPYFREYYGNASSIYSIAKESKKALEAARAVSYTHLTLPTKSSV